jgi:uncharacterized Zn finger protein
MPRENAEGKGRRYLCEGRLLVRSVGPQGIRAIARGNGDIYRVGYQRGGWDCTCPAVGRCSHLVALQLVTVRPGGTSI